MAHLARPVILDLAVDSGRGVETMASRDAGNLWNSLPLGIGDRDMLIHAPALSAVDLTDPFALTRSLSRAYNIGCFRIA